jgi:hypothetical protein
MHPIVADEPSVQPGIAPAVQKPAPNSDVAAWEAVIRSHEACLRWHDSCSGTVANPTAAGASQWRNRSPNAADAKKIDEESLSPIARMLTTAAAIATLTLATSAAAGSWVRDTPVSGAGTLRIDLDFGSVQVASHALRVAHIEAVVRGLGADAFVFGLHNNSEHDTEQLTLTGRAAPWLNHLSAGPGVEIRVLVPPGFSLEIVTREGNVEVSSVSGATVRTRSGSVRVQDIRGSVDIETRDGGEIDIDGVTGAVFAGTSNSPIRARFEQAPSGLIQTRGGGIEIAYPRDVGTHLSAWAPGGCVWIDREVRSGCGEQIRPVSVPKTPNIINSVTNPAH